MSVSRRTFITNAALAVAAAGFASPAAFAQGAADGPAKALRQLFNDSDEASLKLNPLSALFRGDMRYADQFGDYLSDAYYQQTEATARSELKRLLAIPRDQLGPVDRIAYDVFKYQVEFGLAAFDRGLTQIQRQLPIDHFNGLHTFFPDLQSGQSAAPFKTVADYENGLKRCDGFVKFLDEAQKFMVLGIRDGHVQPKVVTQNVIGQLQTITKLPLEESPYYLPIKALPASFSDADKTRLTARYRDVISNTLIPAYQRLEKFMVETYLPASRSERPGLASMKDGEKVYQYLIENHTTTKMTAEEIHNLGLAEVARITAEMNATKDQVGFKGDLKAFFKYLRDDPKFKFESKEALLTAYRGVEAKVMKRIPEFFALTPKSPLEIRAVPEFLEKNQAGAYYQQGTPDGSRPGVFYVNTYDLPSRTSFGMETLYLHEAIPGHHFQISLAQENASLPPFMRFGGNTAYVEGWALYAESIGKELGMFGDPYQYFGRLDDEMLRAMRLVVDTGLHAKGWTREQGIQYFLDNSAQSETDARSEVERYIAIPGQALAYKVGQLTLTRLRAEATKRLGDKFDAKGFHSEVLNTGALPMQVLEAKIRDWKA